MNARKARLSEEPRFQYAFYNTKFGATSFGPSVSQSRIFLTEIFLTPRKKKRRKWVKGYMGICDPSTPRPNFLLYSFFKYFLGCWAGPHLLIYSFTHLLLLFFGLLPRSAVRGLRSSFS